MGVNHSDRGKIKPEKWPDYLKQFRVRHGISQTDLADWLMISKRLVENWEEHINEPPAYLKYALMEVERRIIYNASKRGESSQE